jgi:hypothetical protein
VIHLREAQHDDVARARRSLGPLLAATLAALAVIAVVVLAADALDKPLGLFTREPSESLGAPWYTGFLAHIGVLVWWAGAVIALAGAALLRRRVGLRQAAFLATLGLITAVLAVDDLLRLHEGFLPSVFGIPKPITYAVYVLAAVGWLVGGRAIVVRTEWWILVAAGLLLAASIAIDLFVVGPPPHLFEDGTKFLGTALWTLYVARTTRQLVEVHEGVAPSADAPSGDAHDAGNPTGGSSSSLPSLSSAR